MKVEATDWVEIGLRVEGTFVKGYPERGPTWASGGEPGELDSMENVEIIGLLAEKRVWRDGLGALLQTPLRVPFDLCEGVNLKSPDVQKLLTNIAGHFSESIDEALLGEIPEDD